MGKHITVNYMMAKDSVKKRNEGEGGSGLLYGVFLSALQAYDYQYL